MVQKTTAWMNAGIAWTSLGPVEANACAAKQIPTPYFDDRSFELLPSLASSH